ncbi:MAG: NADH-quinone oxidoreductase subunit A [Candidatus Omnitrophica bacterium]|nr:NADH-quinone oxidoreductase subunit A [Candidatus Omnitrophota bacterium]
MIYIYLPLFILAALVGFFILTSVVLSNFIGPKNPGAAKSVPYECGIIPEDVARKRFPIKFYPVAMLFVVFDVELVFVYPWAVVFKKLGVPGYVEMVIFILVLLAGYLYVLKRGGFEWEKKSF